MAVNNLNKWYLRHTHLARAIGLMVVMVIILLSVIIPSLHKASEIRSQIDVRSREEQKMSEKVSILSSLDTSLLQERLNVIDRALPPRKDVVLYLATVDGLSRELGLSFAGIALTPGDVTEACESADKRKKDVVKGVHVLETEIKINGSKERIYDFLRSLENALPLMQVKDVQVSALGGSDGESYVLALRLGMLWATRDLSKVEGTLSLFTQKEEAYFQQLVSYREVGNQQLAIDPDLSGLGKYDLFNPILQPTESPAQVPVESSLPQEELVQE